MTRLGDYLRPGCTAVDLAAESVEGLLGTLARMIADSGGVRDRARLVEAILERERSMSTGIGEGIALPHALTDEAERTALAACTLEKPIDFGSPDRVPVSIVILIVGPRAETGTHLQVLAKVARLFRDSAFRSAFEDAPDAQALAALLTDT